MFSVQGDAELIERAGHLFESANTEFLCAARDLRTWSRPEARAAIQHRMRARELAGFTTRKLLSPVDLGADVIVAQGTESGGHGARRGRATLPFVPVVVDLVAPVAVLAAGGIADGRGVAAALVLGAAGALIGTRFQATSESLADAAITEAIVRGRAQDTERNAVLDIARGARWPTTKYTARTLGHPYLDRWRGREAELAADPEARAAYQTDVARGVVPPLPVWAGEGVDLVNDLPPAADLVAALATQAENALARAGRP